MIASPKFSFSRPRLVLAYADSMNAARTSRQFRRQGWEVHLAHSGAEARRLACLLHPQLVLLEAELPDESGWLTCAKLRADLENVRVFIVSDDVEQAAAFGDFVGAAGTLRRDQGHQLLSDCQSFPVAV